MQPGNISGSLIKMRSHLNAADHTVNYELPLDGELVAMNNLLNRQLTIAFKGEINCVACGRQTSKSFNQGYCYPCFRSLAACDVCIMSPEKCHYEAGTCREPEWGLSHCMQDHYVYLANSTGVKIGITRGDQLPTRWIDQGAVQALPIFRVSSRYYSGLLEVLYKEQVTDRTQWQRMLKNQVDMVDLQEKQSELYAIFAEKINRLVDELPAGSINRLQQAEVTEIKYPVLEYPKKIKSFNLDKENIVTGLLLGIKGQYLIFDSGVINLRKFSGYKIELTIDD